MTEIVVAAKDQGRAKRIAVAISEVMIDEAFSLKTVENLIAGGQTHIIMKFDNPTQKEAD